jgi:hypothetical protein
MQLSALVLHPIIIIRISTFFVGNRLRHKDFPLNIYTEEIKQLAQSAKTLTRLEHPDACYTGNNPICGDRVIIDRHRYSNEIDTEAKISIDFEVRG